MASNFDIQLDKALKQYNADLSSSLGKFLKDLLKQLQKGGMSNDDLLKYANDLLSDYYSIASTESESTIKKFTTSLYKDGQRPIYRQISDTYVPGFNVQDQQTLKVLSNNNIFFLSKHYNTLELQYRFNKIMKDQYIEGQSTEQTARQIVEATKHIKNVSMSYTKMLLETNGTSARNIGTIQALEELNAEYYQINAVIDALTTDICREMNGKIFPVSAGSRYKKKYLSIDAEKLGYDKAVKNLEKISPMLSSIDSIELVGKNSTELIELRKGLELPPYHYNCRSEAALIIAKSDLSQNIKKNFFNWIFHKH